MELSRLDEQPLSLERQRDVVKLDIRERGRLARIVGSGDEGVEGGRSVGLVGDKPRVDAQGDPRGQEQRQAQLQRTESLCAWPRAARSMR